MPLNLLKLPPYANTDQLHELNRALAQLEHHFETAESELIDFPRPEGRMKASELQAVVDREEAVFTALLNAAHHVYDCLEAPRLPADIRSYSRTWSSQQMAESVGHLRNIRVHWAKTHQYFSTSHPVTPPVHRETRSARLYLEHFRGKYPMMTYRRRGDRLIGNVVNVSRLKERMTELRSRVDQYYE